MKKFYCDACKKEINSYSCLRYLCHIDDMVLGCGKVGMYVDEDENPVSGNFIEVELCHKCYNEVLVPAIAKLHKIRGSCK